MKENGFFYFDKKVFCNQKFRFSRIHPYVAYELLAVEFDWETNWLKQVNEPYYPCLKYRIPADKSIDGTNYFMIAESMSTSDIIQYMLRDS